MQSSITKILTICTMLGLLSACGQSSDAGKAPFPGVKIGKPYNINGQWYTPKYQPHYDETGLASWYGPGFHGKSTANGETFNTHDLTAAHPTLPLPSIVEVTNLSNNKRVMVRVNDRGPFAKNRVIDLSKAAAEKIDMLGAGTTKVRVRYMAEDTERYIASRGGAPDVFQVAETMTAAGPTAQSAPVFSVSSTPLAGSSILVSDAQADDDVSKYQAPSSMMASRELPPLPSVTPAAGDTGARVAAISPAPAVQEVAALAPTQLPASVPIGRYPNDNPREARNHAGAIYVQVGAFGMEENAKKTANQLAMYGNASVYPIEANGRKLYRVRLGPMSDATAAQDSLEKVMESGFKDAKIIH